MLSCVVCADNADQHANMCVEVYCIVSAAAAGQADCLQPSLDTHWIGQYSMQPDNISA